MENNTNKDVEVIEPEIEAAPEAGGLVRTNRESIEDMLYLADNIDKIILAQNKIRAAVMGLAQPGDWVLFGSDKDSSGKAELGFAGAMRIGSTLGVNFTNWEARKEIGRDEIGEWYRWEYECDSMYRDRLIRVYGRASSRDKFLGKSKGEFRPVHEIDEGNIKMIARRASMKEGVKVLFGLHHMDPDYIKKFGIKLDNAGGHNFKSDNAKAAETQSVTVQIIEVTVKEGKSWKKYNIKDVEGAFYATFSETIATEAKAARESKVPAKIDFVKDEYGLKAVSINGVTDSKGK